MKECDCVGCKLYFDSLEKRKEKYRLQLHEKITHELTGMTFEEIIDRVIELEFARTHFTISPQSWYCDKMKAERYE